MSEQSRDFWKECISEAADECGLEMTDAQRSTIACHVEGCHENYGMAFHSPPPSDRISVLEQEAEARVVKLQQEFDTYREGAEEAARKALGLYPDALVSIEKDGSVYTHGGRTEQVQ